MDTKASFSLNTGFVHLKFESSSDIDPSFANRYEHLASHDDKLLYTFTDSDFSRMPHEAVFKAMFPESSGTDQRLSAIQRMNDSSDYLTPDMIDTDYDGGKVRVLELKTCYYSDQIAGRISEVNDLYKHECDRRVESLQVELVFEYVVVSREKVVHNVDGMDLNHLSTVYSWCSELKSLCTQAGWTYEMDDGFSEDQKQMLSNIKMLQIPRESIDPVIISGEMLSHWNSLGSSECSSSSRAILMKETRKSYDKVMKLAKESTNPELVAAKYDKSCIDLTRDYWGKHDGHFNTGRSDTKAAIQLPLFVSSMSEEGLTIQQRLQQLREFNISPTRAHSRLWIASIGNMITNMESSYSESLSFVTEAGSSEKLDDKSRRRRQFRVKPKITHDDKCKLASVGIESRKFREDATVNSIIQEKRKGFNSSTNTDDIDKFISKFSLVSMGGSHSDLFEDESRLYDRAMELVSDSSAYNQFSDDVRDFVNRFSDSNIGIALEILDMIIGEVNISRQQFCNSGEFVLKCLPNINAYLLIKPTKPDSQIFFSVLVPKFAMMEKFDLPFKTMFDFGDCFISEFVSVNQHSITHYLYMREKACSLLSMWMSLHSQYLNKDLSQLSDDCRMHFCASLLFWMEGKEQTSKDSQQIRYAYMECSMDNKLSFNPLKILSKWDEFSRSRLCLWMRKRVIKTFTNMKPGINYTSKTAFDLGEFDKTLDKDCSLVSWVTGKPVGKFEIALNLSYFCVLHNKEDSKEMHGFLKIFQKVVSEELKMRDIRPECVGYSNLPPEELRSHEFNTSFVCHMGDVLLNKLSESHSDPKGWILQKSTEKLLGRTIDKLATMKKSATGELSRDEHIRDSKENERMTCLEASIRLMESGADFKVMKQVGSIGVDIKNEYGGIVSNLFKKLQIGGVREIFVLEFRCRIIVHFLETISRTICDELDNEMLTKGDKKLARTDKHFAEVMSCLKPSKISATVINSDDATTWAQRFVMPVFGCLLSRILPIELLEPCLSVLNLVTSKKLELPHQLLELYDSHPDETGFDDGMNELKKQYMGLSKHNDLLEPRSRMLKNRSNMMQGILHYTSSLLHSAFMYTWEKSIVPMSINMISKNFGISKSRIDLISTTKVSSDDSSCILTAICDREPNLECAKLRISPKSMQMILSIFTEMKSSLYPLFCSKQSKEKSSTSSHSNLEEFNSLWYYKNTLLTPSIKFIAAAIKTHPTSKMDDRFNTFANLRNNLFEHGGSVMICQVAQRSQMSAHYKTLGLRTNKMWNRMMDCLLRSPHPSIGFFLLEHPLCCGMFGQDMSAYMACRDSRFKDIHLGLYKNEEFEFTMDGKPTVRTYISFGQSAKYYEFKRKLGVNDSEIADYVEDNLINLYRDSSTTDDSLMKLKIAASNPALSESMAFQTDSRLHAASSYILQDQVVLQSKGMMGANHAHKTFFQIESGFTYSSSEDYKWLFPFSNFYDSVINSLKHYKQSSLGAYVHKRSVANKLDITTDTVMQSVSLFQVVQRRWFSIPEVKGTRFSHELIWKHYCTKFEWLRDTVQDTLEESPFGNHMSLRNFIVSSSSKRRTVRTYSPSNFASSSLDLVRSLIENCQWRGQKLNYVTVETLDDARSCMQVLTERLWRCLRAPIRQEEKISVIEDILSKNADPFASAELSQSMYELTSGQIALSVLIKFAKYKDDVSTYSKLIPSLIERFKLGVVGYFSVRQRLIGGAYVGPCVYLARMEGCSVEIHAYDDTVRKIVCRSMAELKHMSYTLLDFIKDLNWNLLHKPVHGAKEYWDFTSRRMVKNKGARTVHVVFKDIKPLTSLTTDSMTLEITSYNTLRIVNEEKGRRYTLLSYKISTRDIGNNDTHSENSEEFDDYLSSWLRSKPYLVKEIEDRVEEDQDFELWACDTLRRRLIGLNKLPNLDALFDATDDTLETNSSEERKLDELGAEMAFTMADDEELENMRKLFAYESSESSAADDQKEETLSDEETMERFVMELNDEQPMIDFSWLDYVREPFKPGISNDSAVTNKYFDEFIESYSTVFGGDFYRYFVRKPDGLRKIIQLKRSRELENNTIFSNAGYHDIV